jgi:iron-sulfur cluster assembly accessory protein
MNKLIVTNSAWGKLISIIKNSNNNSFMLSATSGGCNGFNYKFKMITDDKYIELLKNKPIMERNQNVNVLIDPNSEYLLLGTTIDYLKQDLKNGIFENKFIFIPDKKLTYSCGCGSSFNYRCINE